ncbi:hypothetical protein HPB49_012301 [Dermacentor silvarum]|uniref:Uncharacterized protein n=1 Tax=Dermacentor silvarum TaxID=543639 RepID=A0ACB8DPE8_DERSI|nr:hypothetical protein HPB49_012301 [Dermacentor silvarum]
MWHHGIADSRCPGAASKRARLKRKPGLTLARQNSTSKSMPNPYWMSKLTNSLERLQSKTRLKLNARVFDSIAAFRDTHFQRMVLLLRSSASIQPRLQNRASTGLETQEALQSSADNQRTDIEDLKQTPSETLGSWRELLRKAITPAPVAEDHRTVRLGVQQMTNKDLSSGDSVEFAKAQESEVNKILSELELGEDQKPKPQKEDVAAADAKSKVPALSQLWQPHHPSQVARLEELNNHILSYPSSLCILVKERAIAHILRMREYSNNSSVVSTARETLALLGYVDPPRGRGLRILSIDGGGTSNLIPLPYQSSAGDHQKRHQFRSATAGATTSSRLAQCCAIGVVVPTTLELCTGRRVFELFDYVAGVSTGAILGYLLGGLHTSLDRCESLYRNRSLEVFTQNAWWGTGRLVWSHAYYDTSYWTDAIRQTLLETTRNSCSPKVGAISVAVNQPTLKPYVFRNYNLPHRVESHYYGSCKYKMWQAIRASGAAPGYFEEYDLDGFVHQDGGLMCNNPTAVAIHEAKLLWPNEPIQCVVSLGGGRFIPEVTEQNQGFTSLKKKILKVIDSATDTEEWITLDENRAEKLDQLKQDAQMYLRRNSEKFDSAVKSLLTKRGPCRGSTTG